MENIRQEVNIAEDVSDHDSDIHVRPSSSGTKERAPKRPRQFSLLHKVMLRNEIDKETTVVRLLHEYFKHSGDREFDPKCFAHDLKAVLDLKADINGECYVKGMGLHLDIFDIYDI